METGEETCPFCAIVNGQDPDALIVAEGPEWIAFFPREPAAPGHTLVIPRRHVADFWAASASEVADLADAARRLGKAIRAARVSDGMNLITSAGTAAEQSVFHFHLHLVPRWQDDDFGEIWSHAHPWPPDEAAATADLIGRHLTALDD